MTIFSSRLPKKSLNQSISLSIQCITLLLLCHDFQILPFICYIFGCKTWLLSTQILARDCCQASAHCHLKWLCCWIRIWADNLSRTGLSLRSAALHRIQFLTCFIPIPYFTQRPITQRLLNNCKVEQSNECCFGLQQVTSFKIPFSHWEKNLLSLPKEQSKPFWLLT